MGFLQTISAEFKAAASVLVPFSAWGGTAGSGSRPYWTAGGWDANIGGGAGAKYDYRTAAGNLWENSVVAACIDTISQAFAAAPPVLEQRAGDDWKRVDHDLIHILDKPNSYYGSEHLWSATVGSECVNGNGFWRLRMNRIGTPAEIWWEPIAEPEYDKSSFISDYILRVDGAGYRVPAAAGTQNLTGATDVMVHFRHSLHPMNPRWGWTPLSTAMRHVAGENISASFHASLMRNSAVPSGFVSPPPATQGAPQTPVSPDQLTELLERLERKLTGEGAGRIAGMTLPLMYNKVGFSPDEMAIPELVAYYQGMICAVLRVPPMLIGLSAGDDTKTYSNYGECIEDFWRRTIIPMQDRHGSEIESQIFPLFGLDRSEYRLGWDRSQIAALQEDEAALYTQLQQASGGSFLTPNEVRARLGKDPVEGGDDLRSAAQSQQDDGGEGVSPFPPEAKSFFLKVVDANGDSHGADGKYDGGDGGFAIARDQAIEKISKYAVDGSNEALIVLDRDTGKQLDFSEGESDNVTSKTDNLERGKKLAAFHSHNNTAPPGGDDWDTFLSTPSLIESTIVTSDGKIYTMTKPDGWTLKDNKVPPGTMFMAHIRMAALKLGYGRVDMLKLPQKDFDLLHLQAGMDMAKQYGVTFKAGE